MQKAYRIVNALRLITLLSVVINKYVYGWGALEHKLASIVAQRTISPSSKKVLNSILSECRWKEAYPTMSNLTTTSVLPDVILHQRNPSTLMKRNSRWHYTAVPAIGFDRNNIIRCSNGFPFHLMDSDMDLKHIEHPSNPYDFGPNAARKLRGIMRSLVDPSDIDSVNNDVRNIIHLLVDIHQPMHAINMKTLEFPQGDRAGNLWKFNRKSSLHSLWDYAANAFRTSTESIWKNPEENHLSKKSLDYLETQADWLMEKYESSGRSVINRNNIDLQCEFTSGSFADFAAATVESRAFERMVLESTKIAASEVYSTRLPSNNNFKHLRRSAVDSTTIATTTAVRMPKPPAEYVKNAQEVAGERLYVAGVRLGCFLERIAIHLSQYSF